MRPTRPRKFGPGFYGILAIGQFDAGYEPITARARVLGAHFNLKSEVKGSFIETD